MKSTYAKSLGRITGLFSSNSRTKRAQVVNVDYSSLLAGIPNDYFKSSQPKIKEHIEAEFFKGLLRDLDSVSTPSSNVSRKWESILSEHYNASLNSINNGLEKKNTVETIYNIETDFNYFSPNFSDSLQEVFVVLSAQFVVLTNYYNYSSLELSNVQVSEVDTGIRFKLYLKAY